MSQESEQKIGIIGGGLSGLATAFYAEKRNIKYDLFEKNNFLGGKSFTVNKEKFHWDFQTAAPTFHSKEPVNWPHGLQKKFLDPKPGCGIFWNGKWTFPEDSIWASTPLGSLSAIFTHLSAYVYRWSGKAKSAAEAIRTELGGGQAALMATAAVEKKWGIPASHLSPIALGQPIHEFLFPSHYPLGLAAGLIPKYPLFGLGTILEALKEPCNELHLHQDSEVTRIYPDTLEIEIDHRRRFSYRHLINTLPLHQFWELADPTYESKALHRKNQLVILYLDTPQVTPHPVLHVPDRRVPILRLIEPKQWSPFMAPMEHTHLVAEMPASAEPGAQELVIDFCSRTGLISKDQIIKTEKILLPFEEPVPSIQRAREITLLKKRELEKITHLPEYSPIGQQLSAAEKAVDPLRHMFLPAQIS